MPLAPGGIFLSEDIGEDSLSGRFFIMSMDNLLYSECFYYDRDKDYRHAVLDWLRRRNLPLRKMATSEEGHSGIGVDMQAKARAKGFVFPMRKRVRRREVALV